MILVLDSNIWIAERMLRHSSGAALRFHLHTQGARIAVPEVVRREVVLNLGRMLKQHSTDMRTSHEYLLTLVGSLKELVLPTDSELDKTAEQAFDSSRVEILDVPFSLESARGVALRSASKESHPAVQRTSNSRMASSGRTASVWHLMHR